MKILDKTKNEFKEAIIENVEDDDWERIKKSNQFEFDWNKEKKYTVLKIRLIDDDEIQGLMSIEDLPKEYRIHIRLIENGNSNKGKLKKYDFIAGCLIARACEEGFKQDYDGFVSLKPKSEIENLYKEKYGFREMGQLLYTELQNSELLIQKYLGNE